MPNRTSRLSGFYKPGRDERLAEVPRGAASGLDDAAVEALKNSSALPFELLGPAGGERHRRLHRAGRHCRGPDGFFTSISGTEKIAQIQMVKLSAPWAGAPRFRRRRPRSARSPGA